MPTQILEIDVGAPPESIRVRDDVSGVLLVVTAGGRVVELAKLPRPSGGVLDARPIVEARSGRTPAGVRSLASLTTSAAATPLSIVVCTRERPDDLETCLRRLAGAVLPGDDVVVVDNAPATDRSASVASRFDVRYVVEPARGLNRARNAGLRAARHEIVSFIDDDVCVTPHWRPAIAACFADPRVASATGLVLPMELETAAQEEFEIYSAHRRSFEPRVFSPGDLRASAADVVGIGANMAFRRPVALAIGGFDVRLDAGTCTRAGGDTDMFARVLEAGAAIAYSPDAQVWHRHRRTAAEVRACVFGYGAGTFGMLTKRVVERGDLGAIVTGARWFAGTFVKAVREKVRQRPSPSWPVVMAEWAGAVCGPFCFAQEAWRTRQRPADVPDGVRGSSVVGDARGRNYGGDS
jgi:GT2 family glycosyltransferase